MTQEKNKRRKILTISDAISAQTGLGRIHRDLVTRMVDNLSDVLEIATMGYGGVGTSKINVPQFPMEGMVDWILPSLPQVCADFFGKERGICLFIWDAHRVSWFSDPMRLGGEKLAKFQGLAQEIKKLNVEKWLYVPLDSTGPNDKLSLPIALTLLGFDRLLAYGKFGEDLIRRTIGNEESDKRHLFHLPHGIDGETFYELPRKLSRKLFLEYTGACSLLHMMGVQKETAPIADDEVLIHIIGTNQSRKSWDVGLECCAILSRQMKIRVWCHIDTLERWWSLPTLLADYGLVERAVISLGQISDSRMATAYSASDLGLGIGLGEGFGYTIHESLFCGCPCLHGNYAGAPEWMGGDELLVEPIGFYKEGTYGSVRPVFRAQDWADKAVEIIGKRCNRNGDINWERLWPERWEPYLREAANGR